MHVDPEVDPHVDPHLDGLWAVRARSTVLNTLTPFLAGLDER